MDLLDERLGQRTGYRQALSSVPRVVHPCTVVRDVGVGRLNHFAWIGLRQLFIFGDGTTGKESYPGGRFLYAEAPKDGKVVLDFNKAENPPCAFTAFATCPLPPPQNKLKVRIPAGEKTYGKH